MIGQGGKQCCHHFSSPHTTEHHSYRLECTTLFCEIQIACDNEYEVPTVSSIDPHFSIFSYYSHTALGLTVS